MIGKNSWQRGLRVALSLAAISGLVATTGCSGNASSSSAPAGSGQVVVATYGGVVTDAYKSVYLDEFTKETGIKVVTADADPARYASMAQSGKSDWDTIDGDGYSVVDWADKNLIKKMDSSVPRGDLVDEKYKDYAAGGYAQSFVLAYRKSAFPTAPENWADFWNTQKFPGKRGWPGGAVGTAEAALLADGVAADKLYPLDLDRAFNKMTQLKPDMTVFQSYSALTQGLQSGSVDMALLPSGRAVGLAKENPDFAVQWNQNIFYPWNGMSISVGAPNTENMDKLLAFMQDPGRQAKFAELTHYGPTVNEAYKLVSDDVAQTLPGTEEHRKVAATVDAEALAKQNDEYLSRYTKWLTQ